MERGAYQPGGDTPLPVETLSMGSPWSGVLEEVEDELRRTAQRVRDIEVLAPAVSIRVPEGSFSPWMSVLPQVVEELGIELARWAERRGATWFRGVGPSVTVELADLESVEISVAFDAGEPVGG